ncbi:MAG: rod shape-determining protein MreC [Thermomicrobiales bacterium]
MRTVSFRQTLTMLATFLFFSVGLIMLDRQSLLDPIREGLSEVVNPVQAGFSDLVDPAPSQSELEQELEQTRLERDALLAENSNLRADQVELETLRQLQQVQTDNPGFSFIPCDVIGSDPTGTQYWVKINRGAADGLVVGMAVVDPNFYVGQITTVEENEAVVTYIIDTSMRVGAKTQDTRSDGVVYGQWNVGGRMVLRNLDKDLPPNDGEIVVTADESSVKTRLVPPNIPIGVVFGEPRLNAQTDELEVDVYPYIQNYDDLQIVYVVVENANP